MRDPFSKTRMYSEEIIGLNSVGGSRKRSKSYGMIAKIVNIKVNVSFMSCLVLLYPSSLPSQPANLMGRPRVKGIEIKLNKKRRAGKYKYLNKQVKIYSPYSRLNASFHSLAN